jgi:hypothetical protein
MDSTAGSDSEGLLGGGIGTTGRITAEEFKDACREFVRLAHEINDPWKIVEGDLPEEEANVNGGEWYLTVSYFRSVHTTATNTNTPVARESDEGAEKVDEKCVSSGVAFLPPNKLLTFRYDVLYSVSHSVPVLYFLISDQTGRSLTLEELWGVYPVSETGKMWDVVTQQDHPVLNVPFFFVHPCHNWKLLVDCNTDKTQMSSVKYLISWLSIVGNSFGLRLSNNYIMAVSN